MTAPDAERAEAPAYVLALDLAVWCGARSVHQNDGPAHDAWSEVAALARDACADVTVALLLPGERRRALRALDRRLVRLRIHARIAAAVGTFEAHRARFVLDSADELGRMVGGWRRATARGRSRAADRVGHRAPVAPTASSAAAPTGTTRTRAARPTATGTGPGGATTTSAFASSSPARVDRRRPTAANRGSK